MKRKILSAIKGFAFILLLLLMLCILTKIFERKESSEKYQAFYQSPEEYDVLFFGTSHGLDGFSPMELWDEYGIASYNLCQHSEYMPVTYWQVVNALEYSSPKVVVIDPYLISAPDKVPGNKEDLSYVHDSLDSMPFSSQKVNAVFDLFSSWPDRIEFLWNFTMYHNRYEELDATDFVLTYNQEKGGESRFGNTRLNMVNVIGQDQTFDVNTLLGTDYLNRIIDLCNQKGIQVMLVSLPYQASESEQQIANGLDSYAVQKGVRHLNLLSQMDLFNTSTDWFDHGHLNPSGYKKVAAILGKELTANYDIPDRRTDVNYASWYQDYEVFALAQMQALFEAEDFYQYMSLLSNQNLSFTININGISNYLGNGYVPPYLQNLGLIGDFAEIHANKEHYFAVVDPSLDLVQEYIDETQIETSASFGSIQYSCDESGTQSFQIGTSAYTGNLNEAYIRITVFNNRTGELLDQITFYENTYHEFFR